MVIIYICIALFCIVGAGIGILLVVREKAMVRDAETVGTLYIIKTEKDPEPLVYISIRSFEDLNGKDYVKVNVVRESHNEQRPL